LKKRVTSLYVATCNNYVQASKQSTIYRHYLQGGPYGRGLHRNELLLRRTHNSGDVSKLAPAIANYASKSSFMTWTLHLKGEEVFGSTNRSANFSPRANDELHKPNRINFSCPHVTIFACYPNTVDNLPWVTMCCANYDSYTFSRWHSGQWDYLWGWCLAYWLAPS
jgi:hypothetical protein